MSLCSPEIKLVFMCKKKTTTRFSFFLFWFRYIKCTDDDRPYHRYYYLIRHRSEMKTNLIVCRSVGMSIALKRSFYLCDVIILLFIISFFLFFLLLRHSMNVYSMNVEHKKNALDNNPYNSRTKKKRRREKKNRNEN